MSAYRRVFAVGIVAFGFVSGATALAQTSPSVPTPDIVVTGQRSRGSAIGDASPVAVLDSRSIGALGVTSAKELLGRLNGLTTSANGAAGVTLLNGRRVSGPGDFQNLPPEAMEKVEVLPEGEAVRFGYPATVRVVNFITKRHFRALSAMDFAGTTTDGGGESNYAELNRTVIDGPHRATFTLYQLHEGDVGQDQRAITPDLSSPYAVAGNVARADGSSLSPVLDGIAGKPVTVAGLPTEPAARADLRSYATGQRNVTALGSSRTLNDHRETLGANTAIGTSIGRKIDAALNLSAELVLANGRNGYAPAALAAPAGTLPFDDEVMLYRYLPDVELKQQSRTLTMHAGATFQGNVGRFGWATVTTYDQVGARAIADTGVETDRLQTAVNASRDLLAEPAAMATDVTREISRTTTRTFGQTATIYGPPLRLPGGQATVTTTFDIHRTTSTTEGSIAQPELGRSIEGASIAADLPIAAAGQVPVLGEASVNGSYAVSNVSRYGRLNSYGYGLHWRPLRAVQLTASITQTRTAPAVELLVSPLLLSANTPVFDFLTGTTALVTAQRGGNPELSPSSRRIATLGVLIAPWTKREARLAVDYLETTLDGQTISIGSVTPEFQAAFPQLFDRDVDGRLTGIDLRPINLAREQEKRLRLTFSLQTMIGRSPPPASPSPGAPGIGTPPPPVPKPRLQITATLAADYRFSDRLQSAPGRSDLDLLKGATLDGTTGRSRWDVRTDFGGSFGPFTLNFIARLHGGSTVTSSLPSADLRFSPSMLFDTYGNVRLSSLIRRPWARGVEILFAVENITNNRVQVRDALGATPDRFQAAYLDPLGRSLRAGFRKSF